LSFRTYLAWAAAGILLPILVLSTIALLLLMRAEREAAQRGVRETAHAIVLAVDHEIATVEAALRVLAVSRVLARGDIPDFYEQAKAARTSENSWILLFDSDARQLVNTRFPFGTPLPTRQNPERVTEVMNTQQASVSDLYRGALTQRHIITVDVPVPLDDGKRYVLAQAFFAEELSRVFRARALPAGWIIAINDREGRLITRTHRAEDFVGKTAVPPLLAAMQQSTEGSLVHDSREGIHVYDYFVRSPKSGWVVVVGVPTAELEAPARRATLIAAIGALSAIAVALGIALLLGRHLSRAIGGAAQAASALGHGERTPVPDRSSIDELNQLHAALAEAGRTLEHEHKARSDAEAERERLFSSEQTARRTAEAQSRAKDEFLAMLGHELRNPLGAISNAVQLLMMDAQASRPSVMARDIIDRQAKQLSRLLNDLLDVGRAITGKIFLQREPVELAAAVEGAVDTTRVAGRAALHTINVDASPVYIEADRTRIEQIVTNLMTNALTYTEPDGVINVSVKAEGQDAVVRISDNGIGMSPDEIERVFELFYQAKGELHRKGGLGIGLTLVRRLVELHGGTVAVASEGHAKGTTFTIRIPATKAPQDTVSPALAEDDMPARRILLIEDNDDARISLKAILESAGHTIYEASDGLRGVRAAEDLRPDVAIIDIGMPELDGYEVAKALRKRTNHTMLLIALTGYGQPEDERRATAAGFDAHLVKPADIGQIRTLLAASRRTGEQSVS